MADGWPMKDKIGKLVLNSLVKFIGERFSLSRSYFS